MNAKSRQTGFATIILATILFSSMEVSIKLLNGSINPIQLNLYRFLIGGIILLPFALGQLKKSRYKLTSADYRHFFLLGFICVIISMSLFTTSILFLPAYKVAILLSCNTFFSILLAKLILKDPIKTTTKLSLLVAFIGILVIVNPLSIAGEMLGISLSLLSSFTFALYIVLSKHYTEPQTTGGTVATCLAFFAGATELLLVISLTNTPLVANFMKSIGLDIWANVPIFDGITAGNLPLLLFIAIGVTGIGFASYHIAIENVGVTLSSLIFLLKPVLSPIIAFVILREVISLTNIFGLVIITIGSIMLFFSNLQNDTKTTNPSHNEEE